MAIDLDHLSLQPRHDLLKSIVYAMSPAAVSDVWVHGRRVVEGGRPDDDLGGGAGGPGDGADRRVEGVIGRERHVVWQAWDGVSLESCRIVPSSDGIWAHSVALGVEAGTPWAVRYALRCDAGWRTRQLSVESLDGRERPLSLTGDGAGRWTGPGGEHLATLDGCIDVDLTSTAFTNTLPIRRLQLPPGGVEEIAVVYVTVPGLDVSVARQRYQCLSRSADGGRYRFEQLATGFTAEISVDVDGLVVEYPDIARRAWSR